MSSSSSSSGGGSCSGSSSSGSSVAPDSLFVLSPGEIAIRLSASVQSPDYVTPLNSDVSSDDLCFHDRESDCDSDSDSDSNINSNSVDSDDDTSPKRTRAEGTCAAGGGGGGQPQPLAVRGKNRVYAPVCSFVGTRAEYDAWRAALFVAGAPLHGLSKGDTKSTMSVVRECFYCPITQCLYVIRLSKANDSWAAVLEESGVHEHDPVVMDGVSPTGRGLIQYYRTKVDASFALNKGITLLKLIRKLRDDELLLVAAGTHVHPIPSDRQVSRYLMKAR